MYTECDHCDVATLLQCFGKSGVRGTHAPRMRGEDPLPEGASASALFYSLIETAKANGLEPHAYLRFIFEKLPTATTFEDYEALLPWNVKKNLLAVRPVIDAV